MWEQFNHGSRPDVVPLPSTFKAILIQTAVDLNRDGTGSKIKDGPDFKTGYGLIDAKGAIDAIIGPNEMIIEDDIATGQTVQYAVSVEPGMEELKVSLVWDDEPGTPYAVKELVNDLDLVLVDPNGGLHYPWVLDPVNPADAATTGIDRLNNMEQVVVSSPAAGTWMIRVEGYDVPVPVQDYSLISNASAAPGCAIGCWEYDSQCYGDGDGDDDVDTVDWPVFRDAFGYSYPAPDYNPCGDLDHDGDVDTVDWPQFRDNFGSSDVPNDCPMPCVWPPAP